MALKFTSRDLLWLAAFVALSLASMRIGGVLAAITLASVALLAMALLIVALLGHNDRRAFAIGFLVPFLVYAGIHSASSRDELNPYDDFALPTTRSFQPLYNLFVTRTWIDLNTGNEIPDYDPNVNPSRHGVMMTGGMGGMGVMPGGMVTVAMRVKPNQSTFTLLVHSLIAVLLGLAGAKFGVYIHKSQDGQINKDLTTRPARVEPGSE